MSSWKRRLRPIRTTAVQAEPDIAGENRRGVVPCCFGQNLPTNAVKELEAEIRIVIFTQTNKGIS